MSELLTNILKNIGCSYCQEYEYQENINYFKFNVKDPYVSYVKAKKHTDLTLDIIPVSEKTFEEHFYLIAHKLLNVIFYLCKDKLPVLVCDDITENLFSTKINKFYNANEQMCVPAHIEDDVKAIINASSRAKMKGKIEKFVKNHENDKTIKCNVNTILKQTNDLYNNVKKDLENIYRDDIDNIDDIDGIDGINKTKNFVFLEDIKGTTETGHNNASTDGHNIYDIDETEETDELNILINSTPKYTFEELVSNEVKRIEFRNIHNTLKNYKTQVERLELNKVDNKVLQEAKKRYKDIVKQKSETTKALFIAEMKNAYKVDMNARNTDIDDELEFAIDIIDC